MNLLEASKHPDRVAAEAKHNAYEAIWQAAKTLIDSEGFDGRAKLHLIGAIEAACIAYRNCEAVESVIVSSGFFPEEVAVTPDTAEPKPEPEPDEQYEKLGADTLPADEKLGYDSLPADETKTIKEDSNK